MRFTGKVQFRSSQSSDAPGPVGESEILALNPQRRTLLIEATGWPELVPGSLNLVVDNAVVEGLLQYSPLVTEDGKDVRYPEKYGQIPLRREAYYYYVGEASANGTNQGVLVRRAKNPLRERVELFAPVLLKEKLDLGSGDVVEVVVGIDMDNR